MRALHAARRRPVSLGYPASTAVTDESQPFGPPAASVASLEPLMYASGLTVAYWQPYKGWQQYLHYHGGLDVAGATGVPLLALEAGRVTYAGWKDGGGGLVIEVEVRPGTHYSFAHCSAFLVGVGAIVQKGQHIANIGATGWVTGSHVHVAVEINELGPDGYYRWLVWNPKLFMAGGAMAGDGRVASIYGPIPDTTAPPPTTKYPSLENNMALTRFRDEDTTAIIVGGKPYRDQPTVAVQPAGYFPNTASIRLLGRHDPTGSYDTWHITKVYRGNGMGFVWVTSVDFRK
jgi:hypothetical protein